MCNPDVMMPSEAQSVSRSVLFYFWICITFHFFLVGSSTMFLALTCRALFPSSVSCFHIRACADFHLALPKKLQLFHWPSVTPSSRSSSQLLWTFKISFVLIAKLFAFVSSQTPLPLAMPIQLSSSCCTSLCSKPDSISWISFCSSLSSSTAIPFKEAVSTCSYCPSPRFLVCCITILCVFFSVSVLSYWFWKWFGADRCTVFLQCLVDYQ